LRSCECSFSVRQQRQQVYLSSEEEVIFWSSKKRGGGGEVDERMKTKEECASTLFTIILTGTKRTMEEYSSWNRLGGKQCVRVGALTRAAK